MDVVIFNVPFARRSQMNEQFDQFSHSIGCAPCTRAVSVGEDLRAGRWWWEQDSAKECGLHQRSHP